MRNRQDMAKCASYASSGGTLLHVLTTNRTSFQVICPGNTSLNPNGPILAFDGVLNGVYTGRLTAVRRVVGSLRCLFEVSPLEVANRTILHCASGPTRATSSGAFALQEGYDKW